MVLISFFCRIKTFLEELIKETSPLLPEEISTGERTVSSNHNQICDSSINQVFGCFEATGPFSKCGAAGRTNDSATLNGIRIYEDE
jgi:hypothetical protein